MQRWRVHHAETSEDGVRFVDVRPGGRARPEREGECSQAEGPFEAVDLAPAEVGFEQVPRRLGLAAFEQDDRLASNDA